MQDKLLTCQNCQNPFVYSTYEQVKNQNKISVKPQSSTFDDPTSTQPKYCPICTAIKRSEQKHPPKPQKS